MTRPSLWQVPAGTHFNKRQKQRSAAKGADIVSVLGERPTSPKSIILDPSRCAHVRQRGLSKRFLVSRQIGFNDPTTRSIGMTAHIPQHIDACMLSTRPPSNAAFVYLWNL
jgi:hypothetical protein